MSLATWSLPLLGWAALVAAMALAWARQRATRNAGVVDVVWTFGVGGLGLFYALAAGGWAPRRWLGGALVVAWAVRLGRHLLARMAREEEDGRYRHLREKLAGRFDGAMFWFFQAQAALAVVLSLPLLVIAASEVEGWRVWDVLGVAVFVLALTGESIADRQLERWRTDPANRGKTCRAGLWRYSRHPNYFFEWLHWFTYPLLGVGLAWGALSWLAPLVMLFLVLRVTGIPPTEARALESRPVDYRRYQSTTNAFFPGPPRPEHSP